MCSVFFLGRALMAEMDRLTVSPHYLKGEK